MTDNQTRSWVFLATALASRTAPADLKAISNAADEINHAVPTQSELETSLSWLMAKGLVSQNDNKYCLTERGKLDYKESARKTSVVLKIWDNLDRILERHQAAD